MGGSTRPRISLPLRLSLLGVLSVVTALGAATLAFNVFERWQLASEAATSIDETLGWENGDEPLATRRVEVIWATSDWQLVEPIPDRRDRSGQRAREPYGHLALTEMERELVAWCAQQDDQGVLWLADLKDGTCYAKAISLSSEDIRYAIAYVDVTAQLSLIGVVNLAFLAIAVVGGLIAAWAGWRAGRRIDEANAAQKRFYENMSHELKTPLAAIRGYAEGSAAGVVDPKHASIAIVRESERMSRQIEQILDISRLEAGSVRLEKQSIAVDDFVQDCLMPFEGLVRTRGIEVRLELKEVVMRADPDLFAHALENVISNAVRHADSYVSMRLDEHELAVENDGDIPSAAEMPHLFDRFHTGTNGGTGIGLALAREIVELHGWHIDATRGDKTLRMTIRFA